MRFDRLLPLGVLVLVTACGTADSLTSPELGAEVAAQAKKDKSIKLDRSQKKACKSGKLSLLEVGEITADDCVYDLAGRVQYEDLFKVSPKKLVKESGQLIEGSPRFDFTADAGFNGLFGLTEKNKKLFEGLVQGSRTFDANVPTTLSVIGSEKEYGLFFSGYDDTQLGSYTLSTTIQPGGSYQCGEVVFIAGSADFSTEITDVNACAGTIQFGPNVGNPLLYQYRYAKFEAGKEYTVTVSGIDAGSPEVALFMARFAGGGVVIDDTLDLGDGPGDSDRSITLVASVDGYYYIEVSTIPGSPSSYGFSYTEN